MAKTTTRKILMGRATSIVIAWLTIELLGTLMEFEVVLRPRFHSARVIKCLERQTKDITNATLI